MATQISGLNSVRHVDPQDLVPLLAWGASASGGATGPEVCKTGKPSVYEEIYRGSTDFWTHLPGNEITHGEYQQIHGCNYPISENVSITFLRPDGKSETAAVQAQGEGTRTAEWLSLPDEPTGDYSVTIESNSGMLQLGFHVGPSTGAVMVTECSQSNGNQLLLTGFQPGEYVVVSFYQHENAEQRANLFEHIEVEMNSEGWSEVKIPGTYAEKSMFVAIGAESPRNVEVDDNTLDSSTIHTYKVAAYDYSCIR